MFRAYDPQRERLVAVKLLRLDLPPERVHRLVAELEGLIAATPSHPGVVAPLATGIDGVTAYLAEEYVAADSLDVVLRQQKAAVRDSLRVVAQLAGALETAADSGVHHGAMHPRDVLLTVDKTWLTGLGIAQALEIVGVAPPLRRPYTAPEQGGTFAWNRRADVFALAAIVHEMLWGRRVSGIGREAAAMLTEAFGGDLDRLRDVFGRALAEDPETRFASPLDFAEALTDAFSSRMVRIADAAAVAGGAVQILTDPVEQMPETDEPSIDIEPRLPLEPPVTAAELRLSAYESPDAAGEAPTVEPIAAAPEPDPVVIAPDPAIVRANAVAAGAEAETVIGEIAPRVSRGGPLSLTDAFQPVPDAGTEADRSRSAISPLAFALVIGIALGFAAGFGVGVRRSGTLMDTAAVTEVERAAATTGATGEAAAPAAPAPAPVPERPPAPVAPEPSAAPVLGSLLVRSTPPGARVFVDGRDYGPTPVTVSNLARGTHRVRVARDGYVTDEQQLTVTPLQRTHSVTVRLTPQPPAARAKPAPAAASSPAADAVSGTGILAVDSRPAGASVFVDGRLVGTTPLVLREVPAGDHAVHLELDGYQRWTTAARVVPSQSNRVAASLDR